MTTIKEWLERAEFRISECTDWLWSAHGPNAMCIDTWNGEQTGYSSSAVFDSKTQRVYQIDVHDYASNLSWLWIDPEFKERYLAEATQRGVDYTNAYDDVQFIEVEDEAVILDQLTSVLEAHQAAHQA